MFDFGNSASGFLGDFANQALSGLGLGDGSSAAKTIGGLIRPAAAAPAPAPAPAPMPVSGPSMPKISGDWKQLALIGLAVGVGGYFLVRVLK